MRTETENLKNPTAVPDIQRRSVVIQHIASHLISECNFRELHSNVEVTVKFLAFRSDESAYLEGHYPNDAVYIQQRRTAHSHQSMVWLERHPAVSRSSPFIPSNVGPGAVTEPLFFTYFWHRCIVWSRMHVRVLTYLLTYSMEHSPS